MMGFRKSHAVVIGIDAYGQGIPALRTAVNDARQIARVLENDYQYDAVTLLTENVSLARLKALFEAGLPGQIEADDRLLVYFAGHGIALDDEHGPRGYLVPQDASREDKASFLAMTDLNDWLERLTCRHLLLVLDCCFAGAYRWSSTRELGETPAVIHRERYERYIKDAAWQVLTSAAHDQKALDVVAGETLGARGPEHRTDGHSPFAAAFLRALEMGEADLIPRGGPDQPGGDGVITATELYVYLRDCVETGAEAEGHLQTPGLWPLKKHDKGEYIHLVPGHALNLPPAPSLDEANNPWRGLQSYDEEHAHIFFGRSQFVARLAACVSVQPLTVVVGASGTGKSSVVKAGLLPWLQSNAPDAWQIVPPLRPGKSPLDTLAALALPGEPQADDHNLKARLADCQIDPEAFARRVGAWTERAPGRHFLLLVIDQFEELITLCWDAAARDQFIRLLQRALVAHPTRLRVVLTLRSDFEPQFAGSPLKGDWLASRRVVPALTLDEYREIIEKPASVKVLYFQGKRSSQGFIDRLIGDIANTPGALPLLSFTLSELYRRYLQRRGDDRALSEDDYEALGGVGGSLRNRADDVYDTLPDEPHRHAMRKAMLRMISVEGGELARRHATVAELVYDDPEENRRVREVIDRLIEARLIVKGMESDDQPYIEPAHDELVRGWDKLLKWSREEAAGLQLRQRLSPAAEAWQLGQAGTWVNDPGLRVLHQVLDSPNDWLNALETRFIERSWFWRRAIQAGLGVAFAVLLAITIWARYEQATAQHKEQIATSRQLAALSTSERTKRLDRSLLLAAEAYGIEMTREAQESLYHALEERAGITSFLQSGEDTLTSIACSPDGQTIAAGFGGLDQPAGVLLWKLNAPDRPVRQLLPVPGAFVRCLAFSPDGQTIAAGFGVMFKPDFVGDNINRGSGGVMLWETATLKPRAGSPLPVKEGIVASVAFHQDGKRVAVGFGGGMEWHEPSSESLLEYRIGTGEQGRDETIRLLPGKENPLVSGLFKTQINTLERGNGGVALFDVDTARSLLNEPLAVDEGEVTSVAYSPDGKTLVAGTSEPNPLLGSHGGVVLWDAETWQRRGDELLVSEGPVVDVDYSQDGKTIATAFHVAGALGFQFDLKGRGGVVLWDAATNLRKLSPILVPEGDVTAAAFSADGRSLAVSYSVVDLLHPDLQAGGVVLCDLLSGQRLPSTPLHVNEGDIQGLTYRAEENTLAIGCRDCIVLYDPKISQRLTSARLTVVEGHAGRLAYSPDGKTIAAAYRAVDEFGNPDGHGGVLLSVEDTQPIFHEKILESDGTTFQDIMFSPDGKTLAAGYLKGRESGVVLWDLHTAQRGKQGPLRGTEGQVVSVAYSPSGKTIAVGFVVWESFKGHGGVVFWDGNTLEPLIEKPIAVPEGPVSSLAFRPDGETLAVGFTGTAGAEAAVGSGGVVLLNTRSGMRQVESALPVKQGHVVSVAFSPDGQTLAAGYRVRKGSGVVLWNAHTAKRRRTDPLLVREGQLTNVAFSPDGKSLAAGYGNFGGVGPAAIGGILAWDVVTGERLIENPEPVVEGAVDCIAFHPVNRTIAASYRIHRSGGVVIRDMSINSWLRRAGQIANRNLSRKEWQQDLPDKPYRRTFSEFPDGPGLAEAAKLTAGSAP